MAKYGDDPKYLLAYLHRNSYVAEARQGNVRQGGVRRVPATQGRLGKPWLGKTRHGKEAASVSD